MKAWHVFAAGFAGMTAGGVVVWLLVRREVAHERFEDLHQRINDVDRSTRELADRVRPVSDETGLWWCASSKGGCYRNRALCDELWGATAACEQRRLAFCDPATASDGACRSTLGGCRDFTREPRVCIGVE